jgi:hypothetical protein
MERWSVFDSADGVGDNPRCARQGDIQGTACPVEMLVRTGDEFRKPDEKLEADDLSGEQARSELRHDA